MPRSRTSRRVRRGGFGWSDLGFGSKSTDPNAPASPTGESPSFFSGITGFFSKKNESPSSPTSGEYAQQPVDPNVQGQGQPPAYGGYRFRSRRFRGGRFVPRGPRTDPVLVDDGVVLYRKSRRRRR